MQKKDNIFKSDINLAFEKLMDGKAIFVKSYYLGANPQYVGTAIPGENGVFGSILSPSFIAINRYVEEDHKIAAVEFLKYYTSAKVQKEYFMKNGLFSIISSLYDDEEACLYIDCDVIKEANPYIFVGYDTGEYTQTDYYNKIREYVYKYVYGDVPIDETMKKLNDLKKIYNFSVDTTDSSAGLIILITFCVTLCIMIVPIVIHTRKEIEKSFLPNDFWIISLLGSMFIQCTIFANYGKLTTTNCLLKIFAFNTFYLINIIPIFNQLIINFPESNKISSWFEKRKNRYLFLSLALLCNFILIGLFFFFPFELKFELIIDGENYQKCVPETVLSSIINESIYAIDIIIIVCSLLLLFFEWNLKIFSIHTKLMTSLMFIDLLLLIIYEIFNHIDIKNYVVNGVMLYIIIFFISLSNFILVYLSKYYRIFIKNSKDSIEEIIGKLKENEKQFSPSDTSNVLKTSDYTNTSEVTTDSYSRNSNISSRKKNNVAKSANSSKISVLMKYHYRESKSEDNQSIN